MSARQFPQIFICISRWVEWIHTNSALLRWDFSKTKRNKKHNCSVIDFRLTTWMCDSTGMACIIAVGKMKGKKSIKNSAMLAFNDGMCLCMHNDLYACIDKKSGQKKCLVPERSHYYAGFTVNITFEWSSKAYTYTNTRARVRPTTNVWAHEFHTAVK